MHAFPWSPILLVLVVMSACSASSSGGESSGSGGQSSGSGGQSSATLPSCPTDWEPRAETGRCYFAAPSWDFDSAVWLCQESGGELLVPQSDLELELAVTTLCRQFEGTCWLGATDRAEEGSWTWLDGRPMGTTETVGWAAGDDDARAADEDCLAIKREALVDRECSHLSGVGQSSAGTKPCRSISAFV